MRKFFSSLCAFVAVFASSSLAFAEEALGGMHSAHGGTVAGAVALGIGIATLGGTYGQSKAAAAALEGIARNPSAADKVQIPMILALVFIESLVLFTWALMFLLQNKL